MKVLVTGAGGAAGVGTIQSLKLKNEYTIYGADMNNLASGIYLSDKGFVIPAANDPNYFQEIFNLCKKFNIDIIFPTVTEESIKLAENVSKLEAINTKLIASSESTIRLCRDKLESYRFLEKNGILVPKIYQNLEEVEFPAAVKLRFGRGSRGFHKVNDMEELRFAVNHNKKTYGEDSIIQEFVEGVEYSVDVLSNMDYEAIVISPRVRLLVDSGVSINGKIEKNELIENAVKKIVRIMKLVGPSNVQMILDNRTQKPFFIEINPRIAGTTIMTTYAGANIADLSIKIFTKQNFEVPEIKDNLYITRYLENIVLDKDKIL